MILGILHKNLAFLCKNLFHSICPSTHKFFDVNTLKNMGGDLAIADRKLGLFGSRIFVYSGKFVYSARIRSPNLTEFGLESWYSVKFGTEFD